MTADVSTKASAVTTNAAVVSTKPSAITTKAADV